MHFVFVLWVPRPDQTKETNTLGTLRLMVCLFCGNIPPPTSDNTPGRYFPPKKVYAPGRGGFSNNISVMVLLETPETGKKLKKMIIFTPGRYMARDRRIDGQEKIFDARDAR